MATRFAGDPAPQGREWQRRRSGNGKAADRLGAEIEAETWCRRHRQQTLFGDRDLFPQMEEPGHVFDGQPGRHGTDEVQVNFRDAVADDRQVEGLGHAGDF